MKNIEFIKISQKDIPFLRADASEIWTACYTDLLPPGQIEYMLNWMYSEEKIKHEIEQENTDYYFVFHDGIKLGFCSTGPYSDVTSCAKLHKLYLYPEFHGKGFGTAALMKVFDLVKEQGYSSICLNVNKENLSAIKSYERNGFVKEKSIVNDIGGGYVMDDYVMLKNLA